MTYSFSLGRKCSNCGIPIYNHSRSGRCREHMGGTFSLRCGHGVDLNCTEPCSKCAMEVVEEVEESVEATDESLEQTLPSAQCPIAGGFHSQAQRPLQVRYR